MSTTVEFIAHPGVLNRKTDDKKAHVTLSFYSYAWRISSSNLGLTPTSLTLASGFMLHFRSRRFTVLHIFLRVLPTLQLILHVYTFS
jgi:hypothetical protein